MKRFALRAQRIQFFSVKLRANSVKLRVKSRGLAQDRRRVRRFARLPRTAVQAQTVSSRDAGGHNHLIPHNG
jgi:hypothetical protein